MSNVVAIEKLKEVVGGAAFEELVKQLPGRNVYIPKNFNEEYHDRKKRNKLLKADYHAGMQISELMDKYKLSKATIYKVIENG